MDGNTPQLLTFQWFDYTLLFLMFFISILIGIYFGCFGSKQNTTAEYLLGSRNMKVVPVAISLIAGHISGITLLGCPAEVYMFGGQYFTFLITVLLVTFAVIYIYLPPFYVLGVNSSYEYLSLRFDERVRKIALVLYIISSFLYIPVVIFVPALAFNHVSGISIHVITPILCSICIFYTTIGGLKAVVWTDTLQFIVTLAAMFAVFILGVIEAGGFANIAKIAGEGDRLDFFNFDVDPTVRTTFWGISIGMTFSWITALGIAPSCVQRFMSVPTLNKSKMLVVLFGIGVVVTKLLVCISGYIMYAKYKDCDPLTSHQIKHPDQILTHYVLDVAKNIPGLSGIFISGVFSTALSTMSAHLNTLSGVLYEDFLSKLLPQKSSDELANRVIKITVVVAGAICVAMVFLIEKMGGIIQLTGCLSGMTAGPLLALFTLGMLFPQVTTKAVLYGAIASLSFMAFIVFGSQYHFIQKHIVYEYKPLSVSGCPKFNETLINSTTGFSTEFWTESSTTHEPSLDYEPMYLFRFSFYWYPVIGFAIVAIVAFFVTYFSSEKNEPSKRYNKDLYSPLIHRFIEEKTIDYSIIENGLKLIDGKKI